MNSLLLDADASKAGTAGESHHAKKCRCSQLESNLWCTDGGRAKEVSWAPTAPAILGELKFLPAWSLLSNERARNKDLQSIARSHVRKEAEGGEGGYVSSGGQAQHLLEEMTFQQRPEQSARQAI